MKIIALCLLFFLFSACTKKEEKPREVLEMIKHYQAAQEELADYDKKLKGATADPGLTVQLNYEKELAKSRLERIKEQLKKMSPETLTAPAAGGEGEGEHH